MEKNNLKKLFFKNIGFLLVFFVCVLYVVKGLFGIGTSEQSVPEILGNSALSMAVGFAINFIFRQNGILYAEDEPQVLGANSLHAKTVDEIVPYMDLLDGFCQAENERALAELRRRMLSCGGLRYEQCFENGVCIYEFSARPSEEEKEAKKRKRREKKLIKKAQKISFTPLCPSSLTTDGVKAKDPFDFGLTKGEYQGKKSGIDLFSRLVFGVLFGYFTLTKMENFEVEKLLWNGLQVFIYLLFGSLQMAQSYLFVKTEDKDRILKKVDMLQKFLIYAKNK